MPINLHKLNYFKTPGNITLFVRVFLSLILYKILLETVPLKSLLRFIEPKRRIDRDSARIEYIKKFANFILNDIFRTANPCMLRSLLLYRHLRTMGMDIKIAFGVKDHADRLKGHAWLLLNEKPFLEQSDHCSEYSVTYVHP